MKAKKQALPSRARIAQYWSKQNTFHNLGWLYPGCFACCYPTGHDDLATIESEWDASGLERCHLIAVSEGGKPSPSNLVLLCQRCHRDAPMVGSSPQPMIDWINRREDYFTWLGRRAIEELKNISPTLPDEAAALDMTLDEFVVAFRGVMNFMRLGYHPGGNNTATVAAAVNGVVQFQQQIQRAIKKNKRPQNVD